MKCERFNKSISLYLDGRLGETDERALREHLSTCPRCADTLSALEAAQKAAKATRAAEPRAGYWDVFSGRVIERIDAEREIKARSPLRDFAAKILPAPGRRLSLAAGVASIALAIVVGVLYVDRQGGRVVPPGAQAPAEREEVPETARDTRIAEESREATVGEPKLQELTDVQKETDAGGAPAGTQTETPAVAAKKDASPTDAKKESSLSGGANEPRTVAIKSVSADKPAATPEAPAKPAEQTKADRSAETPVSVGGATELTQAEKSTETPRRAKREAETETIAPDKMERSRAVSFNAADKRAGVEPPMESYMVGGIALQKIADQDTLIAADELRALIATWKSHIEGNPTDSLNSEGYRQVAVAYCLLARQSGDEAVISEGAQVIKSYLDRVEDPDVKRFLAAKLEEIEGLREK